jgi:hypothetical protein
MEPRALSVGNGVSQTEPIMSKLSIVKEFWDFLKVRKRYWLAPIIIILVLLSLLIIFAESSAVAPFIYTLF